MSSVNIDELLSKLTREEKVSLLAAVDWWRTPVIKRDGVFVPHIKTTDGPNGARGESYVSGIRAACFPCGTNLGATFDRDLLYQVGRQVALEAKTKKANALLGPTLNMIRSPRGGRNYETYSENPFILGELSAAYVNGCQSEHIAATPKHYVANDTENNRKLLSAEIDEQTLREIYMLPFQLVMRGSDPWCWMTSYNKVNGKYVADDERLVNGVLRDEWGFKGLVVSDWTGVYSTAESVNAGVDVELPGPAQWRAEKLMKAVEDGLVTEQVIDGSARRVLELAKRLGRFENPEEPPEEEIDNPERDEFIKLASASGMVVLKNSNAVLPIPKTASVAIIGHHANHVSLGGGGSARVDALHAITPVEGLKATGFRTTSVPGVPVFGAVPHADPSILLSAELNEGSLNPISIEWFNGSEIGKNLAYSERKPLPEYMIKEKWPEYLSKEYCMRMTFAIRPRKSGDHILSVISTGPAICYINDTKVYTREQEKNLRIESFYFFKSKLERRFTYHMEANKTYKIALESWNTDPEILNAKPLYGKMFQGSALRFHEHIDFEYEIEKACEAAKENDYAIACVGTTNEIESEGFDRDTIDLSGAEYQQIKNVAAHNEQTIVVNFSGSPVDLTPFVDTVPGLVQAWFPGQECGHSLALVLSGDVNPSGRLPFSWPKKDSDNPTYDNFPCDENNIVKYEEGLDVGYRYYDRKDAPAPLFPFGFGLSYTDFRITEASAIKPSLKGQHDKATISCTVENVGSRPGATVIQFYVEMPIDVPGNKRPEKELKEFRKVELAAGEHKEVSIQLDRYSVCVFDVSQGWWHAGGGEYRVHVGQSCDDIAQVVTFEVTDTFKWTGI